MVLRGLSVLPLRAQHSTGPGRDLEGPCAWGPGGLPTTPPSQERRAGERPAPLLPRLPTQGVQAQPLRGPGDQRRRV